MLTEASVDASTDEVVHRPWRAGQPGDHAEGDSDCQHLPLVFHELQPLSAKCTSCHTQHSITVSLRCSGQKNPSWSWAQKIAIRTLQPVTPPRY